MNELAIFGIIFLLVLSFNAPIFYYFFKDFRKSDEERECDEG